MIQERVADKIEEKTKEKTEEKYEYWMACVRSVSRKKKHRLRSEYGNAKKIYNIIEEKGERGFQTFWHKDVKRLKDTIETWNMDEEYEWMKQKGIWFVGEWDSRFPIRLAEIPDPPYALFVKGNLPDE